MIFLENQLTAPSFGSRHYLWCQGFQPHIWREVFYYFIIIMAVRPYLIDCPNLFPLLETQLLLWFYLVFIIYSINICRASTNFLFSWSSQSIARIGRLKWLERKYFKFRRLCVLFNYSPLPRSSSWATCKWMVWGKNLHWILAKNDTKYVFKSL